MAQLLTKQLQILEEVAELAQGNEREFWFRQLAETLKLPLPRRELCPDALVSVRGIYRAACQKMTH